MGMISDEYYRKGYDQAKSLYDKDDLVKELEAKLKVAMELIEEILNDSVECRGDEDCDHCYYHSILDEKIKATK